MRVDDDDDFFTLPTTSRPRAAPPQRSISVDDDDDAFDLMPPLRTPAILREEAAPAAQGEDDGEDELPAADEDASTNDDDSSEGDDDGDDADHLAAFDQQDLSLAARADPAPQSRSTDLLAAQLASISVTPRVTDDEAAYQAVLRFKYGRHQVLVCFLAVRRALLQHGDERLVEDPVVALDVAQLPVGFSCSLIDQHLGCIPHLSHLSL